MECKFSEKIADFRLQVSDFLKWGLKWENRANITAHGWKKRQCYYFKKEYTSTLSFRPTGEIA
ncbi:MAG: hypothetical protein C0430_01875 [Flavobacterium sp.]|nr:hypothetical protein [Flavobacterium sp.]